MVKDALHIFAISALVYLVIFFGSLIPINLGGLNLFTKSMSDYESTDLVFCKFKDDVHYDDRIVAINVGKPDRLKITKVLEKLDSLNVKAIGVDVVFEKFNKTEEDSLLLNVLKNSPNVILADEYYVNNEATLPHVCNEVFCNDQNIGFTNFVAKPNGSIRYFMPTIHHKNTLIKSFATAIVEKVDVASYDHLINRGNEVEQINYRGGGDSYVQLEMDDFLEQGFNVENYSEKIVLVGYLGNDQWSKSSLDKYFTPMNEKLTLKSAPDMFGVLIHANVISMILDQDYINESKVWVNRFACFLFVLIFSAIFRTIYYRVNPGYWKIVRLIQLVIFFFLFLFSTLLFYFFNLKLGIGIALVGVALSWDMVKIYENIFIRRQKFFKPKI